MGNCVAEGVKASKMGDTNKIVKKVESTIKVEWDLGANASR